MSFNTIHKNKRTRVLGIKRKIIYNIFLRKFYKHFFSLIVCIYCDVFKTDITARPHSAIGSKSDC